MVQPTASDSSTSAKYNEPQIITRTISPCQSGSATLSTIGTISRVSKVPLNTSLLMISILLIKFGRYPWTFKHISPAISKSSEHLNFSFISALYRPSGEPFLCHCERSEAISFIFYSPPGTPAQTSPPAPPRPAGSDSDSRYLPAP